ncbi:hypothetical protein SI65_03325 [Aspergillus cristatus]|uniref:Uncharacterized protein n=1 Tax=Aspergillus cristatus TaxID=573508 RepID=A0A1E3BH26_ASPCR|nr:hypothetical protein SI65_03325 [Aspergillus cristatus]
MAGAHAQHFFHTQISANPHSTIRIPEVYHAWRESDVTVDIFMEYIHVNENQIATDERRARAITEIFSTPHLPVFSGFSTMTAISIHSSRKMKDLSGIRLPSR